MAFYGNITNTSQTTFQFDRIYSNRLEMDVACANDSIFVGRYVLVEYDKETAFPVAYEKNGQFYSSKPGTSAIAEISFLTGKRPAPSFPYKTENGIYKDEIIQVQETKIDSKTKIETIIGITFYKCTGGNSDGKAIFEKIDKTTSTNSYINNFSLDEASYAPNSKHFGGYDSTVWVKTTVDFNGQLATKYVQIADLNSVVPTFDVAADAPTMSPLPPHFDADSTNVYYKLHAQPQWGFRIAKADMDKSDENTQWIREFYNPNNNTSTTKYASSVTDGIPDWGDDSTATLPAAIYFNEDGFKKQLINTDERQGEIKKHSTTVTENTIKVEPTGKSGIEYNTHNGLNGPSASVQVDTQELTINLPSIGNMMSDAWDIIHGTNRDNSTVDSLQGRLDFFKNEIAHNEIPIQSSESEGYLVGSVINGAISYENSIDNSNSDKSVYNDNILEVEINSKKQHEHDDAWIATNIDTNQGKDGDKDYHRKAISIHHTFHKRKDSTVNELNINDYDGTSDGSTEDPDTHFQKIINKDTIQLYVPKVDKAGHVVGTDIDKIVLPYGYKHIETNGKVDETNTADLYTTITSVSNGNDTEAKANVSDNQKSCVANNTQDTLNIQTQNKWIQTAITNNNTGADSLVIAHEIHAIKDADAIGTNLNGGNISTITGDNIVIPDLKFDKAGHLTENHSHTYTLPYGYKTITTNGRGESLSENATTIPTNVTIVADNTQDTLAINSGNKWIRIDTSDEENEDILTISHDVHNFNLESNGHTNLNEETDAVVENNLNIPDWEYDKAGHITGKHDHKYTLPFSFKTIKISNSEQKNAPGIADGTQTADSTQDTLVVTTSNKWIRLDGDTEDTIIIGHDIESPTFDNTHTQNLSNDKEVTTFEIYDDSFDEAGHFKHRDTTTVTMPTGYNTITGDSGTTTASATADTLAITANDVWLQTEVTADKVNITHTGPANGTKRNEANKTPQFGDTFTIEDWSFDSKGHKNELSTHTVLIPKGSLNDLTATTSSVITGLSMVDETGAITQTNNDVGKLALTGYDSATAGQTVVGSGDSINTAIGKLQNQIIYESKRINTILTGEDDLDDTINTFKELQDYITTHGKEAADIVTSINNEISRAQGAETALGTRIDNLDYEKTETENYYISSIKQVNGKIEASNKQIPIRSVTIGSSNGTISVNNSDVKVKGLGSAAYTASTAYATAAQGRNADSAVQKTTTFTYGTETKTIQDLMTIVNKQAATITALSGKINELEQRIAALEPTTGE